MNTTDINPNPAPATPLPEPLAYDIDQAAAALNVCTKTVRRLIQRRIFTPLRGIRKILIPRKQIEDYIKACCDVPRFQP